MKIRVKPVVGGTVEGEAVVSSMPISFTGGMDPDTGIIREKGHELEGRCVAGKILVFPTGKGSTTGSWQFYAITGTPMVHEPDMNPIECIKTGDFVRIDADLGIVEIRELRAVKEKIGQI